MWITLLALQLASTEVPPPALEDLTGAWSGTLAFEEEGEEGREEIPVSVEAELFGPVLVRRLVFSDPGFAVRRASLTTIADEGRSLFTSYAGQGGVSITGGPATYDERPEGWRITVVYQGEADGGPASVREVMRLEGDRLTTTVSVNPAEDEEDRFFFRNRLVLEREGDG